MLKTSLTLILLLNCLFGASVGGADVSDIPEAPVIDTPADLANAGIHLARGNYADAAINVIAIVPIVGDAIKGGKTAAKGANTAASAAGQGTKGAANAASDGSKALDAGSKAGKETVEGCGRMVNGKPACFTEGTQIVVGAIYDENDVFVQYVTVNIEDIQVGDLVYSYDTITGTTELKEVTDVFVRESDHINYLTIVDENGNVQVLETTDGHPFWVEAKDLREGDVFVGANGELSVFVSAERVVFPEGINVYNFTVEGNHNYFVLAQVGDYGQTSVLVHNGKYSDGFKHALSPEHIKWALKDKKGMGTGINPKTGKPNDHLTEVRNALKGVINNLKKVKKKLGFSNLKPAERIVLEKDLNTLSKMRERVKRILGE